MSRSTSRSSPSFNFRNIEGRVHQSIRAGICHEIVQYVISKEPNLWGEKRPSTYEEYVTHMVYLALFHLITSDGYIHICQSISFGYLIAKNSLEHNIKLILPLLGDWGRSQITLGDLEEWENAAADCNLPRSMKDVCIWMDSTDLPMQGKKKFSRKSDWWSYKLNGPGVRYIWWQQTVTVVRKYWGGYSPKIHDGTFINGLDHDFSDIFHGSCVIADNHFGVCANFFRGRVKFVTNKAQRKDEKLVAGVDHDEDFVDNITKEGQKLNRDHQKARARIETPFGWVKSKFHVLDHGWRESKESLNCFAAFAFGLYNVVRRGLH